MRILFVNSFEFPSNLLADSSYTLTRRIIESLPEDTYSTFIIPALGFKGLQRHAAYGDIVPPDRCTIHHVPTYNGREWSEMLVSDELFEMINPVNGSVVDYDIVFTNNGAVAHRLGEWLGTLKGVRPTTGPPIVCLDYSTPFPGPECECRYVAANPRKMATHYLGYVNSAATAFQTPYCHKKAVSQIKRLFSPALVKTVLPKLQAIPIIFSKKMVETSAVAKRRDKPTVYWGGRLTATKNVQLALQVADYLLSIGNDIGMVATFPSRNVNTSKIMVGRNLHFPSGLEIHRGLPQAEAVAIMSSCHVSVFPQSLRFGPAAPMEQISAGLIVLINRRDSETILPPEYPWYWSSPIELYSLLRKAVLDYADEHKKQAQWREFVNEHYSLESQLPKLYDLMRGLVADQDVQYRKTTSELLWGRVEEAAGKRWSAIRKHLLDEHPVYQQLKSSLTPTHLNPALWHVYKMLSANMECDLTVPDPLFIKLPTV